MKITFEEEDPRVFSNLVAYIYERRFGDEDELSVRRNFPGSEEAKFPSLPHHLGIACGIFVSTEKTHKLFETTVLTMCLGERYGMQGLIRYSLRQLYKFPLGTKEVAVLAKYVLRHIPENNTDVYSYLERKVLLFRRRLRNCSTFQALVGNTDPLLIQGLLGLMTEVGFPTPLKRDIICRWNDSIISKTCWALCTSEITVEEVVKKDCCKIYEEDCYFGAALEGEMLITTGERNSEGMFTGGNPLVVCGYGSGMLAYPSSSFVLLGGLTWDARENHIKRARAY